MITRIALATLLCAAMVGGAVADVSLQDRQQAACYDDVQRLCGQFVPDTAKTEQCMKKERSKVSAKCRKYMTDE